jgi:F-type H+-transporting ATPase subunit alpha
MLSYVRSDQSDLLGTINETGDYNDDIAAQMRSALDDFKANNTW